MGKANRALLPLQHVGCYRGIERGRRDASPLEERFRGRSQRRSERQCFTRGRGKADEARSDQPVDRRRDAHRKEWADVLVEHPREFQREEGITTRALMDAQQRLPRERPTEAVLNEPVQRADAERTDPHPLNFDSRLEHGRLQPPSKDQPDRAAQAPQREGECAGRRGVEPMHVVDRDDDRSLLAEQMEHVAHGHGEGAMVGAVLRGLAQQRYFQRAQAGRRQPGLDIVKCILEEVAQPEVSEAAFGLGWPRGKNAPTQQTRVLDTCQPERRLSNPRLALEHECRRLVGGTIKESIERAELYVAPDDTGRGHTTIVTAPRRDVTDEVSLGRWFADVPPWWSTATCCGSWS